MNRSLLHKAFAGIGRTFRGEIWDNSRGVPMGRGYANDGRPFEIAQAQYLKPVFRAIADPNIRKVVLMKGVQCLGTFVAEESAAYFIQHHPGDLVFYDCDHDAAVDHAKSRMMPRLRSIPGLAQMIDAAQANSRFDVTTTEIYLPGCTLRLWPLNESSVQRFTARYVIVSDAFLSKRTGLISQALARTTQHQHDKKILIESQGGEVGDDFDAQWRDTNQCRLHVNCPICGESQPFVWERYRPDDFRAVPPRGIPSLDRDAWTAHHTPLLLALERRHAGFKRGPDETALLPDGEYNEPAILRDTFYECYHCGEPWRDDMETRTALDASSHYVADHPAALPEHAGFNWPFWINVRNRWGVVMLLYLKAKRADKELGNREDFKQWWQKRAALPWSDSLTAQSIRLTDRVYDPANPMPDEIIRLAVIDCQYELEHVWAQIWAVDKAANVRLLWRKHAYNLKDVEDALKQHKVQPHHVAIDGRHKLDLVLEWVARNRFFGTVQTGRGKIMRDKFLTWNVLIGDGRKTGYRWVNANTKLRDFRRYDGGTLHEVRITHAGKPWFLKVRVSQWSNLAIKDIARRFRDQDGAPRMEVPPAIAAEQGAQSFMEQMHSEYRTTKNGRALWEKRVGKVHNHDWDNFCQLLVMMDRLGLLNFPGATGAAEGDADATETENAEN